MPPSADDPKVLRIGDLFLRHMQRRLNRTDWPTARILRYRLQGYSPQRIVDLSEGQLDIYSVCVLLRQEGLL